MTNDEFLTKCMSLAKKANDSEMRDRPDLTIKDLIIPLFFWNEFINLLYECYYAAEHPECWTEPRGRISVDDCHHIDGIVDGIGWIIFYTEKRTDVSFIECPYQLAVETVYENNYLRMYVLLTSLWRYLRELGGMAVNAVQGTRKEKNAVKNAYSALFRLDSYDPDAPCAILPDLAPVEILLKKWKFKDYCKGYTDGQSLLSAVDQEQERQDNKMVVMNKGTFEELSSSVRNAAKSGAMAGGEKGGERGARKGAHDASLELVREQTEDGRVRAIGGGAKRKNDIDDDQCRQVLALAKAHPDWNASKALDCAIRKPCPDAKDPFVYKRGMTEDDRHGVRMSLSHRVKSLCRRTGERNPWAKN